LSFFLFLDFVFDFDFDEETDWTQRGRRLID
jgi:hypothetical protein